MSQMYKGTPRLYVDQDMIASGMVIDLDDDQTHYLKNVLRHRDGDPVRLFNGQNGEFVAIWSLAGKKQSVLTVSEQLRAMPLTPCRLHLFFPLIKKDRQDWLIEKAVELGVTDLHPILTDHVTVRDIKHDRVLRQIIEAAEQSERLIIPHLHPLRVLKEVISGDRGEMELFIALERQEAPLLSVALSNAAPLQNLGFMFGPEGGFSASEMEMLQASANHIVSLGDNILRAETAGLYGLIILGSHSS